MASSAGENGQVASLDSVRFAGTFGVTYASEEAVAKQTKKRDEMARAAGQRHSEVSSNQQVSTMLKGGARCTVQGLQASPELNGSEVTVVDEAVLKRYPCKLASGRQVRIKSENLVLRTTCSQCCEKSVALKNCAKCGVSAYCGKPCQVQHWKGGHKHACCSEVVTQDADNMQTLHQLHFGDNKYLCSPKISKLYMRQNECIGRQDFRGVAALEKEIRGAARNVFLSKDEGKLVGVMLQNLSFALKRLGVRLSVAAEIDANPLVERARKSFKQENPDAVQVGGGDDFEMLDPQQQHMVAQINECLLTKDWHGILAFEERIRALARDPSPHASEFIGMALLNISVAYRNTGRASKADELARHPLVQFAVESDQMGPGVTSSENAALIDRFNELCSRRDFHAVASMEERLLVLVDSLKESNDHAAAGSCVNNLCVALASTGCSARAEDLRNKYKLCIQKWMHVNMGQRERLSDSVEKFMNLCASEAWLQASALKEPALEALVFLETEDPQAARDLTGGLMLTFHNTHDHKELIALSLRLLPRTRASGNKRMEAVYLNSIAAAHWKLGEMDKALQYYQEDYKVSGDLS